MTAVTAPTVSVAWDGDRDGHWLVTVAPADGAPVCYPMAADRDETGATWPLPHPDTRPGGGDMASWDRTGAEFRVLAEAVRSRTATAAQAREYGRHLFDALLAPGWPALDTAPAAGRPLVVQLRWQPGSLHRFAWELMHDGTGYLALRAAAPVVFVRLVGPDGAPGPVPITRPPHVLFAVGSALDDAAVRAGAEIMGVLREVERGADRQASAVVARVLTSASLAKLRGAYAELGPDVVHLIGHGRWDDDAKLGKLTLAPDGATPRHGEPVTGEEHTAAELAAALSGPPSPCGRSTPTLVVVSACDSGVASTAAGLPLGAELAAAGVPIVIAMAGAISDTTCRIFTRSVVASAARGKDLTQALATGRYAAFAYANGTPDKVDWALPAIFLRAPLPEGFVLADISATAAVRDVIARHRDVAFPLFAGRPELLDDLDALLRDGNPGVLVLVSKYDKRVGGTRALQELAAEAVRKGHLPVRVGPFACATDAPATFPALARVIAQRLVSIAKSADVPRPRRTLLQLTGHSPDLVADEPSVNELLALELTTKPLSVDGMVEELRADIFALRDALAERLPQVFRAHAAPLLLLDDVHLYTDCVDEVRGQLTATGFGDAPRSLPVVLFAKEHVEAGGKVTDNRGNLEAQGHVKFRDLTHVTMLTDGKDRLALLSWMLNPPRDIPGWPAEIFAPKESVKPKAWLGAFRMAMRDRDFFDRTGYEDYVNYVLDNDMIEIGDDDTILRTYGMLS